MKGKTLADISSMTGYSISTISRVLNGKSNDYRISETAVKKILQAAKDLNFKPDLLAQSLCNRHTHTIGLLVPHINNPFFANIAKVVIREAWRNNYITMLIDTMEQQKVEDEALDALLLRHVDGVIMVPIGNNQLRLQEVNEKLPLVLIDRYFEASPIPYVSTDNYTGAYKATRMLLEAGHRRILCLQGPRLSITSKERVRGFMSAMNEFGCGDRAYIRGNDFSIQNGYMETKASMKDIKPTALFTLSNTILMGSVKALNELDLSIPQDVSIISFDDNPSLSYFKPSVTCIAQPLEQIGVRALNMLLKVISGKKVKSEILLRPTIVKRDSIRIVSPTAY